MPVGMKAYGGCGYGIFESAQDLVGYESLCVMQYLDPELFSDLFNKIINKGITDYYTRSCSYSITTTEGKGPDAALQSLISAGGGNFVKMGEDKNTYGRNMETTQSFSQILEEGILIIGS